MFIFASQHFDYEVRRSDLSICIYLVWGSLSFLGLQVALLEPNLQCFGHHFFQIFFLPDLSSFVNPVMPPLDCLM